MRVKFHQGFSYIELVISVAILALLATSASPYLEKKMIRKNESELRQALREIRTAIDQYKKAYDEGKITKNAEASGYPPNLQILVDGITDIKQPNNSKMRFLRRIPSDPMYEGEPVSPAATWGKRSYDSDAENPTEGADVFDVYSLSEKKGLNGIPYKAW